jgi:hypothetical protein
VYQFCVAVDALNARIHMGAVAEVDAFVRYICGFPVACQALLVLYGYRVGYGLPVVAGEVGDEFLDASDLEVDLALDSGFRVAVEAVC